MKNPNNKNLKRLPSVTMANNMTIVNGVSPLQKQLSQPSSSSLIQPPHTGKQLKKKSKNKKENKNKNIAMFCLGLALIIAMLVLFGAEHGHEEEEEEDHDDH